MPRPRARAAVLLLLLLAAACSQDGGHRADPAEPLAVRFEGRGTFAEAMARAERTAEGVVEVVLFEPLEGQLRVWLADGWAFAGDPGWEPAVPDGFHGAFEALPEHAGDAGRWKRWDVNLRPVRTGDLLLPAFEPSATDVKGEVAHAATSPVTLRVGSRLPDDDEGAMEALELEPVPPNPWPWIGGGAAAVAFLGLIAWSWRRRPRRKPPAAVDVPAHVRAERELLALRDRPRQTGAEVEAFYVDVSSVLRRYIEGRFGVAAPERTTDEFLAECDGHPGLGAARSGLARFLERCDLVKFAGDRPMGAVHEQVLEEALAFVASTRPDREAAEVRADA